MNTIDALNLRIKELCQQQKIIFNTLSYRATMPKSTLMSIVEGKSTPTIQSIARICRSFDISVKESFDSELFNFCEKDDALL